MSAALSAPRTSGRHDAGMRRKAQRRGRERGCWVYIAGEELQAAGIDPHGPVPFYKIATYQRSRNASTAIVSLYRGAMSGLIIVVVLCVAYGAMLGAAVIR